MKTLTDSDDDVVSDNESESDEQTFLRTSNNFLMVFVPDALKHQKRTITIWIITGNSHRCSGKNGVLKESYSESDHVKFTVKSLEKQLQRTSFLVNLQASSKQLY